MVLLLLSSCTNATHGRKRMTIDPGTSTMPGRSTPGFTDQADIDCLRQARGAVRCWASPVKDEQHPMY